MYSSQSGIEMYDSLWFEKVLYVILHMDGTDIQINLLFKSLDIQFANLNPNLTGKRQHEPIYNYRHLTPPHISRPDP